MVLIMKNDENNYNNFYDDTTKYGEFISTFFAWQTLDGQKQRCKELDMMTKNKNENNVKNSRWKQRNIKLKILKK